MGEREQKRLYHAPLGDSIAVQPYPWVYYLLGGSKDQLAVWHGQQLTSPFCDTDMVGLMPEMPHSRQHHGDVVAVGGINHFLIPHRSPGLNHRCCSRLHRLH